MKTNLSSIEVFYLVKELQFLVGAKVEKIFQSEKPKYDLLFSLHLPSKGKQFVFISLPNLLCLSSFKPSFPTLPPSFCSSLRRKLPSARITSIEQVGFERIVRIGFSTKNGLSSLIIELLPPGNMILVLPDEDNKIIAVLHPKIWNDDRKILPNKPYSFPKKQLDPRSLSFDDFSNLIKSSDKESLVKTLAIKLSLGGIFATEVLANSTVDPSVSHQDISSDQLSSIFDSLQSIFSKEISASLVDDQAFPFSLKSFDCGVPADSFNAAVASLVLSSLEKSEEKDFNKSSKKQLSKVQKVIKAQSKSLENLEKSQVEKRKKGELIYSNYGDLKDLLAQINDMRKHQSWSDVKVHFKDHPLKAKIDEHKGTLSVELSDE